MSEATRSPTETSPNVSAGDQPPPLFLIDKSALARAERNATAREAFLALDEEGVVATCDIIDLEVGYSARNRAEYERIWTARNQAFRSLPITPEVTRRARDLQRRLAASGKHRVAGVPDLLIAACAEQHGATVVHYDSDFDIIAVVTNQPMRWLVRRGEVP
jgi:predicted nucleic acid-binding protein